MMCVFLISQSALAEPATTNQTPIKKSKSFTIKLFESMTLDSGDSKKPDDKKKDTKKDTKKKEIKKKVEKKISPKGTAKKPKEIKPQSKTKHDTVKNSINNVR